MTKLEAYFLPTVGDGTVLRLIRSILAVSRIIKSQGGKLYILKSRIYRVRTASLVVVSLYKFGCISRRAYTLFYRRRRVLKGTLNI